MSHFCPQEAMAILSLIPLMPWLLSKVVWLRARYKDGEVRECRGCGTEIERKA
jgi:hypothetical protein